MLRETIPSAGTTVAQQHIMLCGPSRTLAQHRRHMENGEFSNLARELPLARAITGQHIDKTTMVRLALSYIKLHKIMTTAGLTTSSSIFNVLQLMDCFLMVLDPDGDVLYVDMTGNSIAEYIHPEDWTQFHSVFCSSYEWPSMCSVRVKSSLTKRANKKDSLRASPGFKVLRMDMTYCSGCRLVVCSSLPSPVLSSISIRPNSFVITTAVDLSIVYVDSRAEELLCEHYPGSSPGLKGVSFYSLVHVEDVEIIRRMHLEVFKLGSYRPPLYRIIVLQGHHSVYVESNVFRYTSHSNKTLVDSITIVSHFL
ncbi:hypothetical protein ANCDUO_23066 [Ancylostoma duodenale]|uniref:BHLH domain-containing protein n=1 Tax=Ancylostoma duodenale TaxID=51022 RepID=A0A0C2BSP5_9BILA|nr:hypothetical protein ANCDUO_23066 [Ancylostoma duodenale]